MNVADELKSLVNQDRAEVGKVAATGDIYIDPHDNSVLLKGPEPVVADSVAATLAQRGSRYGDFTDHAEIAQALQDVIRGESLQVAQDDSVGGNINTNWDMLSAVQKQALTVIADKIARILSGDPNYDDNWHDIQGYAKLVEDRLPGVVAKRQQEEFDRMSP